LRKKNGEEEEEEYQFLEKGEHLDNLSIFEKLEALLNLLQRHQRQLQLNDQILMMQLMLQDQPCK